MKKQAVTKIICIVSAVVLLSFSIGFFVKGLNEKNAYSSAAEDSETTAVNSLDNDLNSEKEDVTNIDMLEISSVLSEESNLVSEVTDKYSEYQNVIDGIEDYDVAYDNYYEAFESLGEMFENKDFGKEFRTTIEYLFGEGHGTDTVDELYELYKGIADLFVDEDNGFALIERLASDSSILDGLESTVTLNSDGTFSSHFVYDEFDEIAERAGITTDMLTALIEALGMYGDARDYDIEELGDAFANLSIAASDAEGNIYLSKEAIEDNLSSQGYASWEIERIIADLEELDNFNIIDFGNVTTENLDSVLTTLQSICDLNISNQTIDIEGFADMLSGLGVDDETADAFLSVIVKTEWKFIDEGGNTIDSVLTFDDMLNYVNQSESEETTNAVDDADDSANEPLAITAVTEGDLLGGIYFIGYMVLSVGCLICAVLCLFGGIMPKRKCSQ